MWGFYQVVCATTGEVVATTDSEHEAWMQAGAHELATALPSYGHQAFVRLAPWVG